MGSRTLVIFNNDCLDDLKKNPCIGDRLYNAILSQTLPRAAREYNASFDVVDQTHADTVQLMVVDGFSTNCVATTGWNDPNKELTLLKQLADRCGYTLSKKRTK